MKTLAKKTAPPKKPFNFDMARMKAALEAPQHLMPVGLSREEFRAWMKSKKSGSAATP